MIVVVPNESVVQGGPMRDQCEREEHGDREEYPFRWQVHFVAVLGTCFRVYNCHAPNWARKSARSARCTANSMGAPRVRKYSYALPCLSQLNKRGAYLFDAAGRTLSFKRIGIGVASKNKGSARCRQAHDGNCVLSDVGRNTRDPDLAKSDRGPAHHTDSIRARAAVLPIGWSRAMACYLVGENDGNAPSLKGLVITGDMAT